MSRRAVVWLIFLLGLWSTATAVQFALGVTQGLHAEYLAGAERGGVPAVTSITQRISTDALRDPWESSPPQVFSARWFGYLTVSTPGRQTFTLTSDDGASLSIDGQMVVDNSGTHEPQTRSGEISLDRGPHLVLIDYTQAGGGYELNWTWSTGGRPASAVPEWTLSPNRLPYWKVTLGHLLDPLRGALLGLLAVSVWFLATGRLARVDAQVRETADVEQQGRHDRASRAFAVASLALFVGLAIIHTWPLASNPGRLSRNDNGDTVLNEWTIAWVAHQLPTAPLQLYEANIFYPERHTLAYSEALIVQSAMGAPLLWLGASPVLTYNLVLLAGFALTGWAMCLVVTRWTGDRMAGLLSGILGGITAHTLTRLPHLQAQHVEFLPLALLALDSLLREPRAAHAVRLALWFTLQALTSVYLMVFTTAALIAAAAVRPDAWWGQRLKRLAPSLTLAAALALLALLPFMLPYWRVYQEQGLSRRLDEVMMYSASWGDYLTTPGRFHYALWSHRFATETALFPGGVGLLLTGVAIASGVAFRDLRARMCLAAGVFGVWLSFGPKLPGYITLYDYVPVVQSIRAVARFGYLGTIGVAILAGFGLQHLRSRLPARAAWSVSLLLLVVAALEPLAAPLRLRAFDGIPPIYQQLRYEPNAIVAEMPFPNPSAPFFNAPYMLASTTHWKPMLNGYSGFLPDSYRAAFQLIGDFPSPRSVVELHRLGVTHVVVHLDQLSPERRAALDQVPALHTMSSDGTIVFYRLEPVP